MKRFVASTRSTADRSFCLSTGATPESQLLAADGNSQVSLLKLLIETGYAIVWVISGSMVL
ncbi:MAG TPA: hypothetical protein VMA13_11785 [Candidatus Saccharimonadales bacterium]|nr:hypothetical protein [Candidatus Saccharimonadales bacterium]